MHIMFDIGLWKEKTYIVGNCQLIALSEIYWKNYKGFLAQASTSKHSKWASDRLVRRGESTLLPNENNRSTGAEEASEVL